MNTNTSVVAERQAPLQARFVDHPNEAVAVKRVRTGGSSRDPLHGSVLPTGFPGSRWDFGIDSKVGGYDDLPNPGHLLCAALAACLDSTIRMLADRVGIELEGMRVDVTGRVDVRGCLAVDRSIRSGFREIGCAVELAADSRVDPRRMSALVEQAERLCVTLDTLREGVPVAVSVQWGTAAPTEEG